MPCAVFYFFYIFERTTFRRKIAENKVELLANISHDLRTPLTLIKGYAENIAEFSWQKEERYKHDVGIIVRETDRLSNLVNDILEYSCVHGDNGTAFKNENFDLALLAKECAVQFGSQVECDIDYADNSNYIEENENFQKNIFYNYINYFAFRPSTVRSNFFTPHIRHKFYKMPCRRNVPFGLQFSD